MRNVIKWFLSLSLLLSILAPLSSFAGAKKYQVTGVVTALTDDMITLQKPDGDKWEIDRDAKTTVKGELKVGAKVTIQYTMTSASVEVKPSK